MNYFFTLMSLEDIWDELMDMDVRFLLLFVIGGLIVYFLCVFLNGYRILKSDDSYPEEWIEGKVLDVSYKPTTIGLGQKVDIQEIIFERKDGRKISLRNVKTKYISPRTGDKARVAVRNRTIYSYRPM